MDKITCMQVQSLISGYIFYDKLEISEEAQVYTYLKNESCQVVCFPGFFFRDGWGRLIIMLIYV